MAPDEIREERKSTRGANRKKFEKENWRPAFAWPWVYASSFDLLENIKKGTSHGLG
jgi:hypothetical protein